MRNTIAVFIALAFSIAGNTSTFSNTEWSEDTATRETTQAALDKLIYRNIFYPAFSRFEEGSFADVTLRVEANGGITLLAVHSNNAAVRAFVEEQLQDIQLRKDETSAGELFRYRFTFKRQA